MPRYYLLDATHGAYNSVLAKCETRHKSMHPKTALSVNTHKDGLISLVKVSGADDDFENGANFPPPIIMDQYTPETLDTARDLLASGWYPDIEG